MIKFTHKVISLLCIWRSRLQLNQDFRSQEHLLYVQYSMFVSLTKLTTGKISYLWNLYIPTQKNIFKWHWFKGFWGLDILVFYSFMPAIRWQVLSHLSIPQAPHDFPTCFSPLPHFLSIIKYLQIEPTLRFLSNVAY